jgi:hypothetical protein
MLSELFKAPWANQSVGPFMRLLAWIFVSCALCALGIAAYVTVQEGLPHENVIFTGGMLVGCTYLAAVFARVAITGRAPSGWVPWR